MDQQQKPKPETSSPPHQVNVTGITNIHPQGASSRGLLFAILSLVFFAIGLLFNFAGLGGVAFGAVAITNARAGSNNTTAIVLGAIGIVLNSCLLLLVLFA